MKEQDSFGRLLRKELKAKQGIKRESHAQRFIADSSQGLDKRIASHFILKFDLIV